MLRPFGISIFSGEPAVWELRNMKAAALLASAGRRRRPPPRPLRLSLALPPHPAALLSPLPKLGTFAAIAPFTRCCGRRRCDM